MSKVNTAELTIKAGQAVRQLRAQKLAKGLPFMINEKELKDDTCYLEFPDGRIKLVRQNLAGTDFVVVKVLSSRDAACIRAKHKLV